MCCQNNRNRESLGNYKNTGFCCDHVHGYNSGSLETFDTSKCCSVRGFNLPRKAGESRLRHMLCIEVPDGKVLFKWCTQCHMWKNFNEFCCDCEGEGLTEVSTFCHVCKVRQIISRRKQLEKRRQERKLQLEHQQEVLSGHPQNQGTDDFSRAKGQNGTDSDMRLIPTTPDYHASMTQVNLGQASDDDDRQDHTQGVELSKSRLARKQRLALLRQKRKTDDASNGMSGTHLGELQKEVEYQDFSGLDLQQQKKMKMTTANSPESPLGKSNQCAMLQLELLKSIPILDFPFWHPNEHDFLATLTTVQIGKITLEEYLQSNNRISDVIFFPKGQTPIFSVECNPIPKRGNLLGLVEGATSRGVECYRSFRISDEQKHCINSFSRKLLHPIVDSSKGEAVWNFTDVTTPPCQEIRNTPKTKKALENYKFTGFCPGCVHGEDQASTQTWEHTGGQSVRGFNLNRKKVDHRPRHLICLEKDDLSKVFLKWCTQCHTWKNLSAFLSREGDMREGKVLSMNTFCAVCNRRQIVSRKIHKLNKAAAVRLQLEERREMLHKNQLDAHRTD
mmetsp:Transcript_3497/g.8699  ORF Transcript_3497/g.8699 Transcript_3497/m.8699 type:complete len:561 (-) Transcript_3497:135-1817(-)